jgi:hypothetical protein
MFYFVRASSAFDHSYGKGATQYQMQYIIIIIIKLKMRVEEGCCAACHNQAHIGTSRLFRV